MLVFCMAFTFVSGASYDMSTNENLFNITTISNPSDVYVDGVLVAENITEIPKSAVTLGTHNVKIVEGETEVYNQDVDVVNSVYGPSTDYDFADYTTGTYTVNGVKVFSEGASGYASSVTVDEKHDTSFGVVYRDSTSSASWAQNYLLSSIPNEATSSIHYEFEAFSTEQKKDRNMYMTTTADGKSKNINMLNFIGSAKTIRVYNNDKKLEDITRDDSGVWYKMVLDITLNTTGGGGTYNLSIYKESGDEFELVKAYTDLVLPTTVTALNAFRFIGPYDTDAKDSFLAIDNISYSYKYHTPVVLGVNDASYNEVDFGIKSLSVKLSGALDGEYFTKDNVTVGDLEIADATVNGDVVDITLAEKLESDTEYVIAFSEDTICDFGAALGYPLTYKIRTVKDDVEVANIALDGTTLTATVENTTGAPKTVYVVVTYFDGDTIQKTVAVDYVTEAGNNDFETTLSLPADCTDVSVTFVEGYVAPYVYVSEIIELN